MALNSDRKGIGKASNLRNNPMAFYVQAIDQGFAGMEKARPTRDIPGGWGPMNRQGGLLFPECLMAFTLHPRLEKSTHFIGKSGSCHLLLKDQAAFPWILIVPETSPEVSDLHQLAADQFAEVLFLLRQVSQFMSETFQPDKLNVACLGNVVSQLHLHVVARSTDDAAWPGTVWGYETEEKYEADEIVEICVKARLALDLAEDP